MPDGRTGALHWGLVFPLVDGAIDVAGPNALPAACRPLGHPAVPAAPRVELVEGETEAGFLLLYTLLSLAALGWLIAAAGRAPYLELWPPARWRLLVPPVVMLPACLLVGLALGAPNPFSFGGAHPERFDPERPGVVGIARHPLLWALVLWAAAHLVANGDLAHGLLFGLLGLFALAGTRLLDGRRRRAWGEPAWQRLARRSSGLPLAALLAGRWWPARGELGSARLLAGLVLYLALLAAHATVIGVTALAGLG
jgi:uncharacterized membrane protein